MDTLSSDRLVKLDETCFKCLIKKEDHVEHCRRCNKCVAGF